MKSRPKRLANGDLSSLIISNSKGKTGVLYQSSDSPMRTLSAVREKHPSGRVVEASLDDFPVYSRPLPERQDFDEDKSMPVAYTHTPLVGHQIEFPTGTR